MEQQEFLVSEDLNFQPFNEEIASESNIKTEDIKDEDDILLFAQLDNLTNNITNNNEYQIVQEVEVVDQLHGTHDEFNNKLPIDLSKLSTVSDIRSDGNTSHYVRYKLQDGKHVKIWECGICSKEFTHQYTLMRHLPTHTDERKFQCNTCGKGNLRNHIFTHTNERPYKCDICEKGFNQMSNLMCHKLKAHQRAEKPKYVCQICGKCFPKRMGLRHHEQYSHGMLNQSITMPQIPEKLNYMNAIIVDPIKTEAMRLAIESNQTPFALLRPLTGIPVLVRVLPAGDKQMLVPASAEDLKKHSHISITPKTGNAVEKEIIEKRNGKNMGSTVQIKIPVVATVIQQSEQGGQMSMAVVSPGPNGELVDQSGICNSQHDSFVYSSTLTGNESTSGCSIDDIEEIQLTNDVSTGMMSDVEIEFLDENGRRVGEEEFQEDLKRTLLTFHTSPGHQYSEIAALYGVLCDKKSLTANFKAHWYEMNKEHPNFGLYSGLGWERWWITLVKATFKDLALNTDDKKLEAVASHLIEVYKTNTCWKHCDGVSGLLSYVRHKGIPMGIISNFDPRLTTILLNTKLSHYFQFVLSSYEAGVEKPHQKIFEEAIHLSKLKNLEPAECLHVGDRPLLDYYGARNSGWHGVVVNGKGPEVLKKQFPDLDGNHLFPTLYDLHKRFVDSSNDKISNHSLN